MLSRLFASSATCLVVAAVALATTGCGSAVDASANNTPGTGGPTPKATRALEQLADRDVERANELYDEIASSESHSRYGTAGRALTDTLLLPGSAPMDNWIAEDLGGEASGPSGDVFDAQSILYENGGYLYWLSRGTRWTSRSGSSEVQGIKLLIAGRLPWSADQLDTTETFVDGLDAPLEASVPDLIALSERIREIESDIDYALADSGPEERFERLLLPGELFHDRQMTLMIGPSELAVVGAALSAIRGAIQFLIAYRWDWTLERAFKTYPAETIDQREDYWERRDLTVEFANRRFMRSFAEERRQRLVSARDAFEVSLSFLQRAIDLGLESTTDSLLKWDRVDPEYARDLEEFLGAIRRSLSQRADLPFTEPATSANFNLLFTEGRRLPERTWLESYLGESPSDPSRESLYWRFRSETIQKMLVDGFFEPSFDVTEDGGPEVTIAGERFVEFTGRLFDDLQGKLERAYIQ
jgi:hypothetical protein